MRAILVSKRFHPGHYSHLLACFKLLTSQGFDTRFRIHIDYTFLPHSIAKNALATLLECLQLKRGDIFLILFPSLGALLDLFFVRLFTTATVIYIYHEPFSSFTSYRVAGFSWFKTSRVFLIHLVSRALCLSAHKIILPSTKAYSCFMATRKYQSTALLARRYAKLNLIFADELEITASELPRDYISYIGTIAEDHAFDRFVILMHACISNNHLPRYKFLIATRSSIPRQNLLLIDGCLHSGRLTLHAGSPMSNEEINTFYRQSFVVWNAYTRSMQSGVLPKAYMFGTPVLVSSNNTSEYFQDGSHGALISNHYSLEEFINAIKIVEQNFPIISSNCRLSYLANFDYLALQKSFFEFVFS
jgi:hypothetical protein